MEEKQPYNWSRFALHHFYHSSLADVFRAWSTAGGLASFFIREAAFISPDGTVRRSDEIIRPGDLYLWKWIHDYELEGRILAIEENALISFTFGSMTVTVTIRNFDDAVLLTLEQTEIPTDGGDEKAWSHLNCRSCWAHYLTNLKAVLEHGIDLRENDPHRADCISIGFVPGGETP